jgi:spermidine/putrescine transport system permease protein
MYVPIVMMLVFSFNDANVIGAWRGFTLHWYYELFSSVDIWNAFYNSVLVALVTAMASIVLGTLTALAMARYSFKGKNVLDGLLYVPIIIPEITEALTLLLFYLWIGWGLQMGFATVAIGHIAFSIAFVFVIVRARMAGFDRSVEEAAKTLGANEIQTFFRITLPILLPGIVAAGLLAFTLSFDDFYKSAFTTGPAFDLLPLKIFSMASRGGVRPELNALATIALMISMGFALLYQWISKK